MNYFFYLSHYFNIRKYTTLEKFFYIQDKYIDWNKIYGKKGMVEFHILVPKKFIIVEEEIAKIFACKGVNNAISTKLNKIN